MNTLWTDKTASAATEGKSRGKWEASRVEIDSRRVQAGDLFVAIKGERVDGHNFVADAFSRGAVAAMVSDIPEGLAKDANLLVVDDTLKGLEALARAARERTGATVIGITGSVGKTGAKEMIRLALSPHGAVHATSGNYNNHIGLPLSLANLPVETNYAVFEMGMNHAGEIAHLTSIAEPDIAIVTNVEAVHLEYFASVEAIADAKAEIFGSMQPGSLAVLGADHAYTNRLKLAAAQAGVVRCMTCGEAESADCRLISCHSTTEGCDVVARIHGHEISFSLGTTGRHWALTSLFAFAVGEALGLDRDKTAEALSRFREPEGRGRVEPVRNFLLIDDSYNASPASMRAAFAKTDEVWKVNGGRGRKVAALGDMLELGEQAPAMHEALAVDLDRCGFDVVHTAGTLMGYLHNVLPKNLRGTHAPDASALLPMLEKDLRASDVLLIKGSHGSHMYELAAQLKAPEAKEKKHAV